MEKQENPIAKFIRLQNGDDIIAETVEFEDEDGILYMIYNPLKVLYMETNIPGMLSVSFIPWIFPKICEHQEFTIHAQDVLLLSDVSSSMNEYYWNNLKQEEKPSEEIQDMMNDIEMHLSKGTRH